MRRVTKIAIGYAIAAFILTLVATTTQTWTLDWFAKHPDDMPPLSATQQLFISFSRFWWTWGPWLTLLVALTLGATAFLTRRSADITTQGVGTDGPPPPPRIWPSLLAAVFAMPAGLIVGLAVIAALGIVTAPVRLLVVGMTMEIVVVVIVLALARRSPSALLERVALRNPHLCWWAWPLLAAATLGAHAAGILIMGTLTGEPPTAVLEAFDVLTMLRGGAAAVALLAISIPPGFAEELLFRGYVQTRFVQRFGAVGAISLTAALFALAHGDLFYAALVFPTGLWLGWVAWSTRSTIPAMFCHAVQNFAVLSASMLWSRDETDSRWFEWNATTLGVLIVSVAVVAASIAAIKTRGRLPETVEPAA